MEVIDAHQHFWKYDSEKQNWISEEMSVLKRDFLPMDLKKIYDQHKVAGCITVQAQQSEEETEFLLSLANENDFIKGVVGWIDLCAPKIKDRLAHFATFEKLKGFRHLVQDEPDIHFMLSPEFQNGIAALAKHQFTYDILIYPHQMEAVLQIVKKFPKQAFVINHIGKPVVKDRKMASWAKYMRAISEQENVYCKVSGMITEAHWQNWEYQDFVPYLDIVFDAFGPGRIMFGSDYPVCLLAGSFENVRGILEHYIKDFSEAEKSGIWGANALRFYERSA